MKRLATRRPILFGILVTLAMLAFYIVAAALASAVSAGPAGYEATEAAVRMTAGLAFLGVLWHAGWLGAAGATRAGAWQTWLLLVLPVAAYEIIASLYIFFGDLVFDVDPALARSVAVNNMAVGLLEEVAARGLILYALMRLWGNSSRGIVKSVLGSSLIFALAHLIHIVLGKPVPLAALQTVNALLGGIYLAAIVLHGRSLWPAVAYHGLTNAAVNVKAFGTPAFEETVTSWLLVILVQVPIVIFSLHLIRRVPPRPVVPDAA